MREAPRVTAAHEIRDASSALHKAVMENPGGNDHAYWPAGTTTTESRSRLHHRRLGT